MTHTEVPATTQTKTPKKRNAERTRRKRPALRWTIAIVVSLLVITAAYSGWRGYQLATGLLSVRDAADTIKTQAAHKDIDGVVATLNRLEKDASTASNAANDPVLSLLRFAPKYGDDYTAVQAVSTATYSLLSPVQDLVELIPQVSGANIAGGKDGFNLALVNEFSQSLESASQASKESLKTLSTIDSAQLDARIAGPVDTVREVLSSALPTVEKVTPLVEVVPALLAQDSETRWFVTMQNLGEARASGGLPGAWLVLHAVDGKVSIERQGSNDELVAGEPVEYKHIMSEGYQDLWGDYLGSWLSMNLSANFPDNAALMLENWNARGEEQVDGVIALGQGLLPYVAAAVGDVQIDGKVIKAADLDDYLTVGVYRDYPDVKEKDAAVDELIAQVFGKISSGAFDIGNLFETFSQQETGDYLQAWSTDAAIQKQLSASGFDGVMPNSMGPISSVRVINGGGNKLDIFLDVKATYELGACVVDEDANDEYRPGTVRVALKNNAPTSGLPSYIAGRIDARYEGKEAPAGSNHDIVAIYSPVDATVTSLTVNGEDALYQEAEVDGRTVYLFDLELLSGEEKVLEMTWDEPFRDESDVALPHEPQLVLQPFYRTPTVETSTTGACK